MKKALSALCIIIVVVISACGNKNNNADNGYPPNPDSTLHTNDTPRHGPDGYAPPNTQDTALKADSAR